MLGLEVDYYRGRMDEVASLLAGYPFDVLIGSVHWVGAWRFDDLGDAVSMEEWSTRSVDDCWDAYTAAVEELAATGTCDVLAHPDLIKVTGRRPASPGSGGTASPRLPPRAAPRPSCPRPAGASRPPSSTRAEPLLARLAAHGVPFTTASDAHRLAEVADRADDLRALLAGVGVDRLQGYRRRVPHTVPVGAPAGGGAPVDGAPVDGSAPTSR